MPRLSEPRLARVSIGVLLLVVVRSLGEYFRLRYLHGHAPVMAGSLRMSLGRCLLRSRYVDGPPFIRKPPSGIDGYHCRHLTLPFVYKLTIVG